MKTIATLVSFFFIILPTQSVGMNWALEDDQLSIGTYHLMLENENDQLLPVFSDFYADKLPMFSDFCTTEQFCLNSDEDSETAEQFCSELDDEDFKIILPRKNKKRKPKRKRKRKNPNTNKSDSWSSEEYFPSNHPSSKKTGQKRKRYEKEPADPDQPPRKKRRCELKNKIFDFQCYELIETVKNLRRYLLFRKTNKSGSRTYYKKFKLNAVLLYKNGKSVREVCRNLGIPGSTFRKWIKH